MKEKLLWLIQQWWFWLFVVGIAAIFFVGCGQQSKIEVPIPGNGVRTLKNSQNHHCWISQSNFSFIFVSYFLFFLFVFILYLNQFVSWSYRDDKAIQFELDFTILKPLQMRLFDKS